MDWPLIKSSQFPTRSLLSDIPSDYPRKQVNALAVNGAAYTINDAYAIPFELDQDKTLANIHFVVVTQNGNIDVGMYTAGNTKLGSSGLTAVAAPGVQTIALALRMPKGRYQFAYNVSSATSVFLEEAPYFGSSVNAMSMFGAKLNAGVAGLPATFTPATPGRGTYLAAYLEWSA